MADLSRLKDAEIENGNIVNADDLDAEFDQLISGHNDHESRLDDLESNDITLAGIKTFSSIPVLPASNPTTSNQATRMQFILDYGPYQMQGLKTAYASASTITVAAGACLSSDGTALLKNTATKTIDITTSGALGLDTGAEANSTWYYVYLIGKTDGTVSALMSVTNESVSGTITQPTGYTLKRQLPIAIRNDGSGNFIAFNIISWPHQTTIRYQIAYGAITGTLGNSVVLDGGTATSFTDVNLASYIPPISKLAYLKVGVYDSGTNQLRLRTNGESHEGESFLVDATTQFHDYPWVSIPTDASQIIEYKFTTANASRAADLQVMGFTVTEI